MQRMTLSALVAACVGAATGSAQSLNQPTACHPNLFSVSYRPGFNIKASFSGLGGFGNQTDPDQGLGDTLPGRNRRYDDGYNLLDVSDNFGGYTQNWGYDRASQTPPDLDVVVMSRSSAPATGKSTDQDDVAQPGFEVTYNRFLGRLGACPWGLEVAFNYTDVEIHDSAAVFGSVNRILDAYSLGGITPPLNTPPAPAYRGSFDVPGAWISDSPTRTRLVIPHGAEITGDRALDANLFGWRLGPYLDVPLGTSVALSFSAGLAVAYVDSDFRFTETVTVADAGTETRSGKSSHDELCVGGYVGGRIAVALSRQLNVFAGAQYQNVGKFHQTVGGKTVALDLSKSVFLTLGLGVAF